jgi:dienelactone hydrolase
VLILQGTADEALPPDGPAKLAAAFRRGGSSDVTVKSFEGLIHTFLDPRAFPEAGDVPSSAYRLPPDVLGAVAEWCVTHLPQRPDPPPAKAPAKKKRKRR